MPIELNLFGIPGAASLAAFFSGMYFIQMFSNTLGQGYSSSLSYPDHNSQYSLHSCPSRSVCAHIPHQLVPRRIMLAKWTAQVSNFRCCCRYPLPTVTDFSKTFRGRRDFRSRHMTCISRWRAQTTSRVCGTATCNVLAKALEALSERTWCFRQTAMRCWCQG